MKTIIYVGGILTSLLVHKCDRVDLREVFRYISNLLRSRDRLSTTQPLMGSDQDIEYLLGSSREFQSMMKVDTAPMHWVGSHTKGYIWLYIFLFS